MRENSVEFVVVNSKKIKVVWLGPYPSGLLSRELTIVRCSKAHPAGWIVNLANALAKREDIDLHIITASSGIFENQTVSKDGITFHVIRHTFPFTVRGFPEYMRLDLVTRYARLRRQIKQILVKLQPHLIHVHGTESGYGLAALETNVPTIVSIQGIINSLVRVSPSLSFRLQAPIELNVIRKAKYFGTRTAWASSFIRDLNNTAIIYYLPEAIDHLFFKTSAQHSNPNILIVGSVMQRKGIEDALRAMSIVVAACPSAKLLVVGEGRPDYLEELKKRTRSAGIEANVEWLGFKDAEKVAALHAKAAILIHPSHMDNSPNSVAEAMASGVPVIASDVGGIPSMIENGATGLLIQPENHHQLAEAIMLLLQDEAERKRLASRAKQVALQRHLPSEVAQKTMDVYKDIVAKEQSDWTSDIRESVRRS
jgi:glycosyltransferase involved in cell wall biosynthesis